MFILGSSSPRRIELLKNIIPDFKILNPTFDESTVSKNTKNYNKLIVLNKLISLKNYAKPEDFLMCFDTVIKFNNEIIGKPIDLNDAIKTLEKLSNKRHYVITSCAFLYQNKIYYKQIKTKIYFNKLSEEDIKNYIKEVNVLDKAGSYAIQEKSSIKLIKKIKGSYNNVVGLPLEYVSKLINKLGII